MNSSLNTLERFERQLPVLLERENDLVDVKWVRISFDSQKVLDEITLSSDLRDTLLDSSRYQYCKALFETYSRTKCCAEMAKLEDNREPEEKTLETLVFFFSLPSTFVRMFFHHYWTPSFIS